MTDQCVVHYVPNNILNDLFILKFCMKNTFLMVRKYFRNTNRCAWSKNNAENVIKASRDGTMGYLKAAKEFQVTKTTLKRRCKGQNAKATEASKIRTRLLPTFVINPEISLRITEAT